MGAWEKNNPNWGESDKGKEDYLSLVQHLMGDVQENGNKNKIIKTIAKSTVII
jgi:hypothetical protein